MLRDGNEEWSPGKCEPRHRYPFLWLAVMFYNLMKADLNDYLHLHCTQSLMNSVHTDALLQIYCYPPC